jgi:hypothetical protein
MRRRAVSLAAPAEVNAKPLRTAVERVSLFGG